MGMTQDIEDALYYAMELTGEDLICCDSSEHFMTLSEIAAYDDPSGWLEFDQNELVGADMEQIWEAAASFRGEDWADLAVQWVATGNWPPVVVIEGERISALGDGRGRFSLACALGLDGLPVVLLEQSEAGTLCAEVRHADGRELVHFREVE